MLASRNDENQPDRWMIIYSGATHFNLQPSHSNTAATGCYQVFCGPIGDATCVRPPDGKTLSEYLSCSQ